jgi:hypothetical protein
MSVQRLPALAVLASLIVLIAVAHAEQGGGSAADRIAFVCQGDIGAQNRILELKPGSSPRRIIPDASEPAGTMPGK